MKELQHYTDSETGITCKFEPPVPIPDDAVVKSIGEAFAWAAVIDTNGPVDGETALPHIAKNIDTLVAGSSDPVQLLRLMGTALVGRTVEIAQG